MKQFIHSLRLRTLLLLLFTLVAAGYAQADVVINETNFPDEYFRKLVTTFDKNSDNVLSDAELAVDEIDCSRGETNYYIGSLKGIEFFTSLKKLRVVSMHLTSLDLSQNTLLETINCSKNEIETITLNCPNLTDLDCSINKISVLPIGNSQKLKFLNCSRNYIKQLPLNHPELEQVICDDNIIGQIDLLSDGNNGVDAIDGPFVVGHCPKLKYLGAQKNAFTSIDVSNCPELETLLCYDYYFYAGHHALKSLDVSHCKKLKTLDCHNQSLACLDLSQNSALTTFDGSGMAVSLKCNYFYEYVDSLGYNVKTYYAPLENNSCFQHYDPNFRLENITSINCENRRTINGVDCVVLEDDEGHSYRASYTYPTGREGMTLEVFLKNDLSFDGQEIEPGGLVINDTRFPDANFREYVKSLPGAEDGQLREEECASIKTIDCHNMEIASLKGLEYFQNIEKLDCSGNQLVHLDLTKNAALQEVKTDGNCRTIQAHYTLENGHKSYFFPIDNIAENPLYADGFRLENARNWTNATISTVSGVFKMLVVTDPSKPVVCTYYTGVDGKDFSFTLSIDTVNSSYAILIDENNFPDPGFRESLLEDGSLGDANNKGFFSSTDLQENTSLSVAFANIKSLKGIELFTNLEILNCSYNELTSLDLSGCTALKEVRCYNNELTSLNVNGCTALKTLYCGRDSYFDKYFQTGTNHLTSLDLSSCTALTDLTCNENQLTSLDLSHCTNLTSLDCSDNTRTVKANYYTDGDNKVYCLPVEQPSSNTLYADGFRIDKASNWTNASVIVKYGSQMIAITDATQPVTYTYNTGLSEKNVTFTLNIDTIDAKKVISRELNEENFPDSTFRAYVSENFDTNSNGLLENSEINGATQIGVAGYGIANFKGIELLTEITSFDCQWNNQIKSIDLTGNTKLTKVFCNNCDNLQNLNVSTCADLTELNCYSSDIKSLDLSNNHKLEALQCQRCYMDSINLDGCVALQILNCAANPYGTLDVSSCTNLTSLNCYYTQLDSLDVSNCTKLTTLDCHNNHLTWLDLSNNTSLTTLNCTDNKRTVDVDCKFVKDGTTYYFIDMTAGERTRAIGDELHSKLGDGFNIDNVVSWTGAAVGTTPQGNTALIIEGKPESITYTYNTQARYSKEMTVTLNLNYTVTTGITDICSNARIFSAAGEIRIEGSDEEAKVYTTSGSCIYAGTDRAIPASAGIYIVKIGNKAQKVVVK